MVGETKHGALGSTVTAEGVFASARQASVLATGSTVDVNHFTFQIQFEK